MDTTIIRKQNPWWEDGKVSRKVFPRAILPELIANLKNPKIIALVGSRQVGKTSLIYLMIDHLLKMNDPKNIFYFNLDDFNVLNLCSDAGGFIQYLGNSEETKYVFLDEIQRLESPGLFLKTIYDLGLDIKFTVSGSSQLEMRSKLKEFLVGRVRQFEIGRLSFDEIVSINRNIPKNMLLNETLIYGGYPEPSSILSVEEKKHTLHDIYDTYLKKDVSDFAKVENIGVFNKLLTVLASQIGKVLSVEKISDTLKISRSMVEKYLDILEGTFIIKRLQPFYQNYSKELRKSPKMYFLDLGLRNLLISNWAHPDLRVDRGELFENFVFLELYNKDFYKEKEYYFWRTTNQTEIDFIIKDGLNLKAVEAKLTSSGSPKSFRTFKEYYPLAHCEVITSKNYF